MKKTSPAFGFNENEMADAFQGLLSSPDGLSGVGTFDEIYREIDCRQGRPDFITLRKKVNSTELNSYEHVGLVGAYLLSLLKPAAPRTLQYLLQEAEYSASSVKRSLAFLEKSGFIEQTPKGSYVLGSAAELLKPEVWAFELKLSDSKRAVFQAQQCKAFAERVIIVVPPGQAKNYDRFRESMTRWGIGLASFDPHSGVFILLKSPRKTRPFSREHRMYAISQMLASQGREGKIGEVAVTM
jgi:hypothetical protein